MIGFTCGAFDVTHTGHALMFKDCSENCDYLIVGLQSNPTLDRKDKNRPIQTMSERYLMLRSIKYIDEIIPYETEEELVELLRALSPNVRFVGEDHKGQPFTGDDLPIRVHFNKRSHNFSTSNLRRRIK